MGFMAHGTDCMLLTLVPDADPRCLHLNEQNVFSLGQSCSWQTVLSSAKFLPEVHPEGCLQPAIHQMNINAYSSFTKDLMVEAVTMRGLSHQHRSKLYLSYAVSSTLQLPSQAALLAGTRHLPDFYGHRICLTHAFLGVVQVPLQIWSSCRCTHGWATAVSWSLQPSHSWAASTALLSCQRPRVAP